MSCHGTHVVVIEIPEGTPRPAAGDLLNLQTVTLSTRRYPQLAFLATNPPKLVTLSSPNTRPDVKIEILRRRGYAC
jgi:hypothetical protein